MDQTSTALRPVSQGQPAPTSDGTLSMTERAAYVGIGLVLAAAAAKPRPNPVLNLLALGAGAFLAWRGAEGQCQVKAALARQGLIAG